MRHALAVLAGLAIAGLAACKGDRRTPREPRVLLHEDGVENAYPRLSADGREILYQSNRTGTWQLYILDAATGTSRVLTREGNNNLPDWSPDGSRIAFVSDRDGDEEIYISNPDGSEPRRLTHNRGRDLHPYFSPDGKALLYNSQRDGGSFDVYALDLATGSERRITATDQDETCARYSPDGTQIVLLRNDIHGDDLWLLDASGERNLTATPQVRDGPYSVTTANGSTSRAWTPAASACIACAATTAGASSSRRPRPTRSTRDLTYRAMGAA